MYSNSSKLVSLTLPAAVSVILVLLLTSDVKCSNSNAEENTIPDFLQTDTEAMLLWEAPEELKKEYPYYLSGFDDEDAPIWVIELGKWDIRKNVESGPEREQNFRKYILQMLSRVKQSASIKATPENPTTQLNFIFDVEGYTVSQTTSPPALALTIWMTKQFEQAFRNKLRYGYFINGNFVFTTVWNLIKPVIGPNVYKIEVLGTNKERWLPVLLRAFPRNQLPKWYGGSEDHTPVQVYG